MGHTHIFSLVAFSEDLYIWRRLWTLLGAVKLQIKQTTIIFTTTQIKQIAVNKSVSQNICSSLTN